ncbi:hypothetical protein ABRQ22_17375 [Cellulosimicrobium sp. ES-005]|uniref:Uncharacterized protein n=1 Tax=Cellulosimicrobium sp. ES-005 TaxID=3163031 RepID=A0AAU8G0T2_9MICO
MSTETPHHTVTARFEDGRHVEALSTMTCTAPADALCHAVWDCDCEAWDLPRVEDGRPVHMSMYGGEHTGQLDPEFCNLREWFDNSDETLNGEITFPVTPEWTGDGYLFNAAQDTP